MQATTSYFTNEMCAKADQRYKETPTCGVGPNRRNSDVNAYFERKKSL